MLKWFMTFFVAASLAVAAVAQDTFPGTDLRQTITPQEIPDDFYPVVLKEPGAAGLVWGYPQWYYIAVAGEASRSDAPMLQLLTEIMPISWTNGKRTNVYGQDLLVTYTFDPQLSQLQEFSEGHSFAEIKLKLKLVNPNSLSSVEAVDGMNRDRYVALLGEFQTKVTTPAGANPAAEKTQSLSNAKQVATGLMIYLADYDDEFPYVESTKYMQQVVYPYVKNRETFKTLNPNKPGDLRYNVGVAGANSTWIENPAETPLIFDPTPWPDGTYLVAFADAHTKFVSAEEWARLQKFMKVKGPRKGKPVVPPPDWDTN